MYAIMKSGARQYRATIGDTIRVEKLAIDPGERIELDEVLLVVDDNEVRIGQPTIEGAKVLATVVAQEKGPKITVFKYRPRKRYQRHAGHRQLYTRLRIDEIIV
ncbi:MAG: 50S ribosomal protein L21 [Anaerolineae bacterium]